MDYVTTREAAIELGYTVQHTRLLIREGKLRGTKLGRDWLVVRESLAEYRVNQEPASSSDALERADLPQNGRRQPHPDPTYHTYKVRSNEGTRKFV